MSYYTAKVQLTTIVDTPNGTKEKKATEMYLVEAMSVTEAEAKVVKDFQGVMLDFEVKAVTNSRIIKIIDKCISQEKQLSSLKTILTELVWY